MKGQATLEYLLLSVVGISLLSVSVFSLMSIRESSERSLDAFRFRSSAGDLSAAMNEVCALGSGNGREMALSSALSIGSERIESGWLARFSSSNLSMVRKSLCEVNGLSAAAGAVYVENDDGRIRITER